MYLRKYRIYVKEILLWIYEVKQNNEKVEYKLLQNM